MSRCAVVNADLPVLRLVVSTPLTRCEPTVGQQHRADVHLHRGIRSQPGSSSDQESSNGSPEVSTRPADPLGPNCGSRLSPRRARRVRRARGGRPRRHRARDSTSRGVSKPRRCFPSPTRSSCSSSSPETAGVPSTGGCGASSPSSSSATCHRDETPPMTTLPRPWPQPCLVAAGFFLLETWEVLPATQNFSGTCFNGRSGSTYP
jgi:hypothetical protein